MDAWIAVVVGLPALTCLSGCTEEASCEGHGCDVSQMGDGGEVRLELRRSPLGDSTVVHAFRIDQQTPKNLDRPFAEGTCTKVDPLGSWPYGVAEKRTFFDMGSEVRLECDQATVTMPCGQGNAWGMDTYPVANGYCHADVDVATAKALRGQECRLVMEGSERAVPVDIDKAVYLPKPFITSEFDQSTINIDCTGTTKKKFVWDTHPETQEPLSFFYFKGNAGTVYWCLQGNTGEWEIPAEVAMDLDAGGIILHGVVRHNVLAIQGRRFEGIGVDCELTKWQCQ
jgi:hypothetical protein